MVYMCHIFFIQSIIHGHLGWFQVFAILKVLQQTYGCMCLYSRMIYNPLGIYPVMGWLGQMEFLFLDPWEIATLSSTMVELASVGSRFFNDHCSNWCEMIPQCGLDLHFSNDQWWWTYFPYVCWPHICLLLKCACSYPLPTFEWVCLFFSCVSALVLCRFWILALCQMDRLQKFFPILLVDWFALMVVSFAIQKL